MLPPIDTNARYDPPYIPAMTGQTSPQLPGIPRLPTTGVAMNTYGSYAIDWQDSESQNAWQTLFGGGSKEGITIERLIAEGWTVKSGYLYPPEGEKGRLKLSGGPVTQDGGSPSGFSLAGIPPIVIFALIGAAIYFFFGKGKVA